MSREIADRLVRSRMKKMHESEEKVSPAFFKQVEGELRHRLGNYETDLHLLNLDVITSTPEAVVVEVEYEVAIRMPYQDYETGDTLWEDDVEYRMQKLVIDNKADMNESQSLKED